MMLWSREISRDRNWCRLCCSCGTRARQVLQPLERQHADLGVLERDRLAAVAVGADAVHADDVAEHVVAGDLLAAVLGEHRGLERAEAHRVQRVEGVAGAVERRRPS